MTMNADLPAGLAPTTRRRLFAAVPCADSRLVSHLKDHVAARLAIPRAIPEDHWIA